VAICARLIGKFLLIGNKKEIQSVMNNNYVGYLAEILKDVVGQASCTFSMAFSAASLMRPFDLVGFATHCPAPFVH